MNWGFKFPEGPNENPAYNWGWYYAPLMKSENNEEISIIAGKRYQ